MVSYFTSDASGGATNFQKEISDMMHGFGDNVNPNPATVVLIETVVSQQLGNMLQDASTLSTTRGGRSITNFDVIYLIRKNKIKLKRLHDYQLKLDQIDKSRLVAEQAVESVNSLLLVEELNLSMKNGRTHIHIINELDEFGEVNQIKFDGIDYVRKLRAAKLTEILSFEEYQAYHKARCSSFRSGSFMANCFTKFERWINPNKEFKITTFGLEVLSFLAYETVAEIVDAVFLVRQDSQKENGDPFIEFEDSHFCSLLSLNNSERVPAITVEEVQEVMRKYYSPRIGMNKLFYKNMLLHLPRKYRVL